ncbi:hypothetical protein C8R44DRAFT_766700 [Mycena epipterygia]|nr:hypothetical protein C8R44DRAFT_766700 [Mycena epipterygia]
MGTTGIHKLRSRARSALLLHLARHCLAISRLVFSKPRSRKVRRVILSWIESVPGTRDCRDTSSFDSDYGSRMQQLSRAQCPAPRETQVFRVASL